jgi:hypothetical protein
MLPMLPAVVENCAECTYPLPEELSIGLLFFGLPSAPLSSLTSLRRRQYRGDPLHLHRPSPTLQTNWRLSSALPPFQSIYRRSLDHLPALFISFFSHTLLLGSDIYSDTLCSLLL